MSKKKPIELQRKVETRSNNQIRFLRSIRESDVTFCVGPAGTGKTYMSVYAATRMLRDGDVDKLVLCRPAVQSGEKLGYLPGDLKEKVEPYLRPLFDSLEDLIGRNTTRALLRDGTVEIIPFAFMRGRTFNNSAIILDEAQNTTVNQMKMFLTRVGEESKAIVNGDVTQNDLERGQTSGLVDARNLLQEIDGVSWVVMEKHEIVRHPVVERIVEAYERRGEE